MKKFLPLIIIFFSAVLFFQPFFLQNKLPIPSDTIVGLYHPFRDLYAPTNPNGVAYKNFLITDPVRQQYPWKSLTMDAWKQGHLPLWNPYEMAGMPLLATVQPGAFYPLNILLLFAPFSHSWSIFIFLQQILAGIFLFWYLRSLKLETISSLFGAVTYSFSGFIIAWLEWGTIVHVILWLPLILLSIDKIFSSYAESETLEFDADSKSLKNKRIYRWFLLYLFSFTAAFFAGHLQPFFYLFIFAFAYFIARWIQFGKTKKVLLLFLLSTLVFFLITFIQWLPTIKLILQSARDIDLNWQQDGWFIPWQHLIQFVAPDFFGNPTTLNYWGVWNYAELVGYISIAPLLFAGYALFYRHDRKTFFFGSVFFLSLLFALPTFFAQIPFLLHLSFFSTAQPTRLLFLIDFSLVVLAVLGMDYFFRSARKKHIISPIIFLGLIFACLWAVVLFGASYFSGFTLENVATAKRNLLLPTILFGAVSFFLLASLFIKNKKFQMIAAIILLVITFADLFRFAQKFTPFTDTAYLFPQTASITFLQEQKKPFRIMTTDSKILPPNFSVMYRLESLSGYDPLYLRRYAEFIIASERDKPDITPPFGFNRIINPQNVDSRLIDLLGAKYILSLTSLESSKLKEVFTEGNTHIYENKNAYPRAFFVKDIKVTKTKQASMNLLFDKQLNLRNTAIVETTDAVFSSTKFVLGRVENITTSPYQVRVHVVNKGDGFLVLTDSYYPTWDVRMCTGDKCIKAQAHQTDYLFQGVLVPAGTYDIIFAPSLL